MSTDAAYWDEKDDPDDAYEPGSWKRSDYVAEMEELLEAGQ